LPKSNPIHSFIKAAAGILFTINCSVASTNEQSPALQMTIQSCEHSANQRTKLACVLMMHDSLCYNSIIKGALDLDDDRHQCILEAGNPLFKDYLTAALKENTGNELMQKQLHETYEQWQNNVENMSPQPLEPEYQFKLRRDSNSQKLMFKLMPIY
jgi:hypothetical protein